MTLELNSILSFTTDLQEKKIARVNLHINIYRMNKTWN